MTTELVMNMTMEQIAHCVTNARENEPRLSPKSTIELIVKLNEAIDLPQLISKYELPQYSASLFNEAICATLGRAMSSNGSATYDMTLFGRYWRVISDYCADIPQATLQVGPGGSLGCEALMCMNGVKHAMTLDPFPLMSFDFETFLKALELVVKPAYFLKSLIGPTNPIKIPEVKELDTAKFQLGDSIVEHIFPRYFEDTQLESSSVDFLFSHAVFEHVLDPDACIDEILRVLKPGGVTAHCIDLRDHRDFSHPLAFLEYSERDWAKFMETYCEHDGSIYMNRWRASDFVSAFEARGFEILEVNPEITCSEEYLEKQLPKLDQKYANYDLSDLANISTSIVARRVK
jgi:SAM-dependent methyltransferase